MKRDERLRLWRMYRHRPPASIRARLVEYLDGPFTLRSHLRLLATPGDETRHHQRAILDALEVEDTDPVAVAAMADGDPWIALRGGWSAELVEPASRLVDALGMTFTEEEIRLYAGLYADDGPFEITDEQLDRMEDHAVADSRFAEGMATPEGMALWADVVAADFLVKEASRLRVRTTGEEAASVLLARARARWQRFEDDPDGMATTAIAKAAAAHGYPQLSHQLSHQPTRMADLWSSWSPQKEPLGEPLSRAELPSPIDPGLGLQSLNFGEQIETGGKIEWPEARWLAFRRRAPLVVQLLAWVWWKGRWRAKAGEALQRLRKVEAATVRTVESVVEVLTPGTVSRPTDDGVALVTADGREAGRVLLESVRQLAAAPGVADVEAVRAVADELVRARARTAGVYSFLHAVQTVTELYRHGINDRAETWNDWKEWAAEVAELQGVKLTGELRGHLYRAAWFGNAVTIPLFGDRTQKGLWLLTAPDPFKRGRRPRNYNPRVTFSYAPIFSPEWANDENRKDRNRGVRLLAIPTRIPIGIRNPARHAAAQLYSLSFMAEVAANARDTEEGALLALPTVHRLAVKHGLGEEEARAQLTALMDGGLIEEHGKDRYRLGTQEARDLSRPKGQRMKGPKWKR